MPVITLRELQIGCVLGDSGSPTQIVACHGCFDLIHPGHLEHLNQAKAMGEFLIVGVTADQFIHKGPGRPTFNAQQRAEHLAALRMVDYAVIIEDATALPLIEALKPDIYCKGPDYQLGEDGAGNLGAERRAVEAYGGKVTFTTGQRYSSTAIINAVVPQRSPEVQSYLDGLRKCYSAAQIIRWIDAANALTVQVIG